jgi:hypothetical protein
MYKYNIPTYQKKKTKRAGDTTTQYNLTSCPTIKVKGKNVHEEKRVITIIVIILIIHVCLLFGLSTNSPHGRYVLKCHRHEHLATCHLKTATARGVAIRLLLEKERWLVDGIGWNNLNLDIVLRLSALTFSAFIGFGKYT